MVPSGWKRKSINDIATVSSGGTPSRKNESYWNGSIPWVTTAEVHFGTIINSAQKITDEGLSNSSAKLFPIDTILIAMYGQGKTRGQVAKLGIEATTNQACAAIILKNDCNVDFYFQYLKSQYENIRDLSNSGGQENLSGGIVKSIQVPVPPLPEQQKIAQILNTWDKAISTTESLIANSQQQKKSLMQQLLTGKKRFAGFEGEWEEIKFNDIVLSTQLGTTDRHKGESVKQGVPLLKMGNLTWGGFLFNSLEILPKNKLEESLLLKSGDFLFNTRNTPELVGKSAVWKGQLTKATFDNNINRIIFVETIDPSFICVLLTTGKGKSLIRSLSAGSTSVAAIYWKDLKSIKFKVPSLPEQQKIASALTAADQEIDTLQQKLTHLKQEKKALMQQLLTGKRRVKVDNETEAA